MGWIGKGDEVKALGGWMRGGFDDLIRVLLLR